MLSEDSSIPIDDDSSLVIDFDRIANNIDDYIIIWFDVDNNQSKTIKKLKETIKNVIEVFHDPINFYDFISSYKNETIILIASGIQSDCSMSLDWKGTIDEGNKKLNDFWHRILLAKSPVKYIYILDTKITIANFMCPLKSPAGKDLKNQQKIYYYGDKKILLDDLSQLTRKNHLIFLDPTLALTSQDFLKFNSTDKYFQRCDLCFDYIISLKNQTLQIPLILIIVSICTDFFDRIHWDKYVLFASYLHSIYVFDYFNNYEQYWLTHREIFYFIDNNEFLQQISNDITFYTQQSLTSILDTDETKEISLRSIRKDKFQFLTELLISLPSNYSEKLEMIEECLLHYHNNKTQLELINTFNETYEYNQVLWWYTCDCFLYRLLNKACRTENIDLIYTFRFYIRDLYHRLRFLHENYILSLRRTTMIIVLYRGQQIPKEEFNELQNNIGKLYSSNTFLSTTTNIEVAHMFAGENDLNSDYQSIVFSYIIDINILTKPFANICRESFFKDEDEVLLSMGTIFRIDSILYSIERKLWYVTLILTKTDDEDFQQQQIFNEMKNKPLLLVLGNFLFDTLYDYDKAERYYRLFIDEQTGNLWDLWEAYNALGLVCMKKGQYASAMDHFERTYQSCLSYLFEKGYIMTDDLTDSYSATNTSPDFLISMKYLSLSYKNISKINIMTEDFLAAVCSLRLALFFAKTDSIEKANILNLMGDIYRRAHRWQLALNFYRSACNTNPMNQKSIHNIKLITEKINEKNKIRNTIIQTFGTCIAIYIINFFLPKTGKEIVLTMLMQLIAFCIESVFKYTLLIFFNRRTLFYSKLKYILYIWTSILHFILIFSNLELYLGKRHIFCIGWALFICKNMGMKRYPLVFYMILFNPNCLPYYFMIIVCLHRSFWIYCNKDDLDTTNPRTLFD